MPLRSAPLGPPSRDAPRPHRSLVGTGRLAGGSWRRRGSTGRPRFATQRAAEGPQARCPAPGPTPGRDPSPSTVTLFAKMHTPTRKHNDKWHLASGVRVTGQRGAAGSVVRQAHGPLQGSHASTVVTAQGHGPRLVAPPVGRQKLDTPIYMKFPVSASATSPCPRKHSRELTGHPGIPTQPPGTPATAAAAASASGVLRAPLGLCAADCSGSAPRFREVLSDTVSDSVSYFAVLPSVPPTTKVISTARP